MKREAWKDTVEAIGILAIIASLILVAYELRQNTLMIRAQVTQNRAELAVTEQVATYNSDHLPSILIKVESGQELTAEEMLRYRTYVRGFLRNQDNAYWQFRRGLLENNTPASIRLGVSEVVGKTTLGRQIWAEQRSLYTEEFVFFIESEVIGD